MFFKEVRDNGLRQVLVSRRASASKYTAVVVGGMRKLIPIAWEEDAVRDIYDAVHSLVIITAH